MGTEDHDRVAELFLKARDLDPESRETFLAEACEGDARLRGEVESLLEHDQTTVTRLAESADHPALPAKKIGDYRIFEEIGEGGMGEVYLAEQSTPRRKVALKIIKWGMDTKEVVARFESERQALALMDHPNIAKVFDAGATEQGRPYFVMEYVHGVPITDHCNRHRLTIEERLEVFMQACEGVQHAHQKAVIHRDIKPSNILVTIQDDRAVPKIIDFGVAKATAQRLTERTVYTEIGQLIGTPEYMSPEQAEMTSQEIDARTDVYSLGVLLYELLVGVLPFDSERLRRAGFDEMRRTIREDEPQKPSARASGLGAALADLAATRRTDARGLCRRLRGDLDWITLKALEKDRTRRYGSPREFAADIRRHLDQETVLAGAPSTARRVARVLQRRWPLALAAALVVLVVAWVGSSLVPRPGRLAGGSAAPRVASLAVLPFTNVAANPAQEYFVDGMTEAMITTLGTIGEMRVTGRHSSMRFKDASAPLAEIARTLDVDAVMDGSVLLMEDRVRIHAELIDARTEERLWGRSYERDLENILDLQGEVALAIADEIKVRLTSQERFRLSPGRKVTPQAHDLLLQGKHLLVAGDAGGWQRALVLFQRAIDIDPAMAEAHAGLARAYGLLMGHHDDYRRSETLPKVRAAVQSALELGDTLAFAHTQKALMLLWADWNWTEAQRSARRAVALNPNSADARHAYAWSLMVGGRPDEALRQAERARQIEPVSVRIIDHQALMLYYARRYDEALEVLESGVEFQPDYQFLHLTMANIAMQQGKREQAFERYQRFLQVSPSTGIEAKSNRGYVYAVTGQTAEAVRLLDELREESERGQVDVTGYDMAVIANGLGDRDQAFAFLEQGYEEHNTRLLLVRLDPWWDPLRSDPRYSGLMARMRSPASDP